MKAFLVTGTDTGIGKTFVGSMLAKAFSKMNMKVGVFKPVETGIKTFPKDAKSLQKAASSSLSLDTICPYQFKDPVSPWAASQIERKEISFKTLENMYHEIAETHDITVVESAGGLLVPISNEGTFADLAKRLNLPILLVVGLRLGAVNHALLTLEVAKMKDLTILGYILNEFTQYNSSGACTVEQQLKLFSEFKFIGRVPHGRPSLPLSKELAKKVLDTV